MLEFALPLLPASSSVEDAFAPMIRGGVSGVVTASEEGSHQLLHYSQILAAWERGIKTLGEIQGYRLRQPPIEHFGVRRGIAPPPDYSILQAGPGGAVVRSRAERLGAMYLANAPGFCCSGTVQTHCYPPHVRGITDDCVVPLCDGKV